MQGGSWRNRTRLYRQRSEGNVPCTVMFYFHRASRAGTFRQPEQYFIALQGGRDEEVCDCRTYADFRYNDVVRAKHRDTARRCTGTLRSSAESLWHAGSPAEGVWCTWLERRKPWIGFGHHRPKLEFRPRRAAARNGDRRRSERTAEAVHACGDPRIARAGSRHRSRPW